MSWMTQDLTAYCSSKAYHDDYAEACPTTPLKPSQRAGICHNFRGKSNGSGASSISCPLTIHKFQRSINKRKTFHQNSEENKYSNTWKHPNTQIDHTHFVFNDEHDVHKHWDERAVFGKIQFLHNVLEECLNMDHAKALLIHMGSIMSPTMFILS
jgi:hypothetical protein